MYKENTASFLPKKRIPSFCSYAHDYYRPCLIHNKKNSECVFNGKKIPMKYCYYHYGREKIYSNPLISHGSSPFKMGKYISDEEGEQYMSHNIPDSIDYTNDSNRPRERYQWGKEYMSTKNKTSVVFGKYKDRYVRPVDTGSSSYGKLPFKYNEKSNIHDNKPIKNNRQIPPNGIKKGLMDFIQPVGREYYIKRKNRNDNYQSYGKTKGGGILDEKKYREGFLSSREFEYNKINLTRVSEPKIHHDKICRYNVPYKYYDSDDSIKNKRGFYRNGKYIGIEPGASKIRERKLPYGNYKNTIGNMYKEKGLYYSQTSMPFYPDKSLRYPGKRKLYSYEDKEKIKCLGYKRV